MDKCIICGKELPVEQNKDSLKVHAGECYKTWFYKNLANKVTYDPELIIIGTTVYRMADKVVIGGDVHEHIIKMPNNTSYKCVLLFVSEIPESKLSYFPKHKFAVNNIIAFED